MSGRRSGSFLGNIVCNIASKERQPKEGLVQILDIPSNLSQLDLSSIAGLQVPIYDGIFFCHAFFKKRAKAELMLFLQSNYPSSVYSAPWRSKPKAKTFAKSPEFSTECPAAMEEDNVIFCNITEWRLITRFDSVVSHSAQFIVVVEALEMRMNIHFKVLAERLYNRRFPIFAHRNKDFYDSTRFLSRFLDHACIGNGDRNIHCDPSVKSVMFKLLNAWKQAGVAVQMTSMDAESGTKRVTPFIWCTTSYVELKLYQSEKELVIQLGKHIYKMAKPKLAELISDVVNLAEKPCVNEKMRTDESATSKITSSITTPLLSTAIVTCSSAPATSTSTMAPLTTSSVAPSVTTSSAPETVSVPSVAGIASLISTFSKSAATSTSSNPIDSSLAVAISKHVTTVSPVIATTSTAPMTNSSLSTETILFHTPLSNSSGIEDQTAMTASATTTAASPAKALIESPSPSMTVYDEESMNLTMDESAVVISPINDGVSLTSLFPDDQLVLTSDSEANSDHPSSNHPSVALSKIVNPSPNNSSFFTADTSPQSTDDRLSTFMSEIDDSSSDVVASITSSIARLSSQEFMSRIARCSKGITTEEISFDVAHSPPPPSPPPSQPLTGETQRLRSLSQSSITEGESQRLNSLSTSNLIPGGDHRGESQRLTSISALNSSFNLGDGGNEGDEKQTNDNSFETISQMELAGVSSFYAIRTKGSPRRSPKRKSSWRGGDSDLAGEGEAKSPKEEEKMLPNITPRRPIRDPLERSFVEASKFAASTSSSPPMSRATRSLTTLPSQLEMDEALDFIQQQSVAPDSELEDAPHPPPKKLNPSSD